jgi:hypothetical protein
MTMLLQEMGQVRTSCAIVDLPAEAVKRRPAWRLALEEKSGYL